MPVTYSTFETSYGVTPWMASLDKNQRTMYVPDLLEAFVADSLFYRMIDYAIDLNQWRTQKVVFTQRLRGEPNIAPLDNRQLWLPQFYSDSREIEISCARYGDKIQYHWYDDMITYWKEGNTEGLGRMMRNDVAPHMIESLDLLARNAFLNSHFVTFAGTATGFNNLAKTDTFDVGSLFRSMQLTKGYRMDLTQNPTFCLTAPSAVYQIVSDDSGEWLSRNQYANPSAIVNYEAGTYMGIRTVSHPLLTLWNVGPVIAQTTVTAAIGVGDGAPGPDSRVDGVWNVGQDGATHYVTVASSASFNVGEIVTLHRVRPAANGVRATQNGVQWDHADNINLRIVAKDTGKLMFERPILSDSYGTEVSSGVYGYITKARPVHAALFIMGPRAVVAGVTQPPQTYEPAPVDDTQKVYRLSWDAYLKYQPMFTDRFLVHFFAGPVSMNNAVVEL